MWNNYVLIGCQLVVRLYRSSGQGSNKQRHASEWVWQMSLYSAGHVFINTCAPLCTRTWPSLWVLSDAQQPGRSRWLQDCRTRLWRHHVTWSSTFWRHDFVAARPRTCRCRRLSGIARRWDSTCTGMLFVSPVSDRQWFPAFFCLYSFVKVSFLFPDCPTQTMQSN